MYTDENIVHTKAVEAAARLILNELKVKQPELLKKIDINKILPELQKTKNTPSPHISALDEDKVVALLIGQNVEDVKNLQDMSEFTFCKKIINILCPTINSIFYRAIGTSIEES